MAHSNGTRQRLRNVVLLAWIASYGDAATTFLPSLKESSKRSPLSKVTDSTDPPSQLHIATDPFSSMGYCLATPSSVKKPRNEVGLPPNHWMNQPGVFMQWGRKEDWMRFLKAMSLTLQISLETLLGFTELLTKQVVTPTWHEIQKVLTEESTSSTTSAEEYIDPGDFLCEVDGWQAYFDRANTGLIYYFHTPTGTSQWEPPFAHFPVPQLNRQQLELTTLRYNQHSLFQSRYNQQSLFQSQLENSSNPLLNSVFQGIQDILFPNSPKEPGRKPDAEDEDDAPSKPWWTSVMDNVFESGGKAIDRSLSLSAVPSDKSRGKDDTVPFFAAFRDDKDFTAVKEEEMPGDSEPNDVTTALSPLWDMFVAVVQMAANSSTTVSSVAIESNEPAPLRQQQPWDFFFSSNKKPTDVTTGIGSSKTILKSNKNALTAKGSTGDHPNDVSGKDSNKSFTGWMNDLPLFLTRDASRTIPLFGLLEKSAALVFPKNSEVTTARPSSPSSKTTIIGGKDDNDRLQALEEKRYAASRARQANLRRTYGTIIHDRSPTVSLTSIKLNKKKSNADWYKYLDD